MYYKDLFEEAETLVLESVGYDFECDLPYTYINEFCLSYLPLTSKESIMEIATKFCNDSFKLPLCLFYHPKVIAAASIHMAALWRKNKGIDCGLTL